MRTILFLFILLSSVVQGQYQVTGKIIDSKTKEPLPFVNIISVAHNQGTASDIDGLFAISSTDPITILKLSFVGYKPLSIDVSAKKKIVIKLKSTSYNITEFKVLPGVNPAERIIKEVIKNRHKHNPEKSLNFKYESYSKMYFSALLDSSSFYRKDTADGTDNEKALAWMENHYLFLMESVTERKHMQPDKSYEQVIASKVSGVKNPTFALMATELQSFSFYNPVLKLLQKTYVNPVSKNSINKYLFLIEDTVLSGVDTVFVLSFRPRKGKNIDALKGLLYINTDGYALQNVVAEPAENDEIVSMKIQQRYEKIKGSWFPVQLNSDLIIDMYKGGEFKVLGVNRTYIKNVEINPSLSKKEFTNVITEINDDIGTKSDLFWENNRAKPLTEKEVNSYTVIDSIGKENKFDKKLTFFENLGEGRINWGIIDFNLDKGMGFTKYEGVRLGGGIRTSNKLLKWASVGGYGAYGLRDKTEKYGGDINLLINDRRDIGLKISYQKDVEEPGVVSFIDYKIPVLSTAGNRRFFNLDRMNNIERIEARVQFRTMRYLKVYAFAKQEQVAITNDYFYEIKNSNGISEKKTQYQFNEFGVEFRYAFKEKVLKSGTKKYPVLSKYPILFAKIEQGVKNYEGDFEYTRFTFRTEKKFFIKNWGHPKFFLEAGYIYGNVPQHKLNSSLGSRILWDASKTPNVSTENTFETMLPYEFFSSEYVNLHFRHSFGSLLFSSKKINPEFEITSSVGFGNLSNKNAHKGVEFNTMEKGFYESGIVVNNVLRITCLSLGAGVFYRYGPYRLEKASDNLAVKFSLSFIMPKKFKFRTY